MALSLAQQLATAPPEVREQVLAALTPAETEALLYDPHFKLRPDQLAVALDRTTYLTLLLCGRMWGKSETASHRLARAAIDDPGEYAIVAPKEKDVVAIELEGPSGLFTALPPDMVAGHNAQKGYYLLTNGSRIHYRGSNLRVGGLRGLNLKGAVVAEAAAIPVAQFEELLWEHLMPAVRIGENPWILLVCTPKPLLWLRNMVTGKLDLGDDLRVVRGRSEDNTAISRKVIDRMRRTMTARQARQELDAEIVEDIDGALWAFDLIARNRVLEPPTITNVRADRTGALTRETVPDYRRVVVAVDPSGSTTGDEVGIGAAAIGNDGYGYVIADRTAEGLTPSGWARRALQLYLDTGADAIAVERNYGGDMAKHTLLVEAAAMAREGKATKSVRVIEVNATRGKVLRAEPIVALYENNRVRHVGELPELEEQMTTWTPDSGYSPGRIDWLVWALTALALDPASEPAETSSDSPLDW